MIEWTGPAWHVLRLCARAYPPILRWYYTEQKLDSLLWMDVPGANEGIGYHFGSQEGRCWLLATNLSPIDLTIDRLQVEVIVDGGSFTCALPLPHVVKGGSRCNVYVKGKSPMPQSSEALAKESRSGRISIEAFIKSNVREFCVRRNISDVRNLEIS